MGHGSQLREIESARLDSWKEIASFLHRDARTVRRWERERGLPVHRVPGGERSGVFAYATELENWLHTRVPPVEVTDVETAIATRDVAEGDEALGVHASITDGDITDASIADAAITSESGSLPHVSAFRSINSLETAFATDTAAEGEQLRGTRTLASHRSQTRLRVLSYQAAALVLGIAAAITLPAAIFHYREARQAATATHRPNPAAQDLYLRGRYYWNLRTEAGLDSAVDLFTQSIVNDPQYAEAYAGLADSYLLLRQYGHMPDSEAYPRALAAARQAIALDESSPDAHRSIAFVMRFWDWDMAAAEKEYRRAIELNPKDSQSHHWYATALFSSGRFREALTEIDIARRLEPQSVSVLADRGLILSMMDVQNGVVALKQVEEAQPNFVSTHVYLAGAYLQIEDYGKFLAESRLAADLSQNTALAAALASAETTLARRGPAAMLRQLAGDFAPLADRGSVPAYSTACLFGLAGDQERAMRYLRLSREHREPGFLSVATEQAFAQLRSSGEYNMLVTQRDASMRNLKQPVARLDKPVLPHH